MSSFMANLINDQHPNLIIESSALWCDADSAKTLTTGDFYVSVKCDAESLIICDV